MACNASALPPSQFYQPEEWKRVRTMTATDMIETLRVINSELASAQAMLDKHDAKIPPPKKTAVDALLAALCTSAQYYMEQPNCNDARDFINSFSETEKFITAQIAEIEQLLAQSQSADAQLDALMKALTLSPAPDGDRAER